MDLLVSPVGSLLTLIGPGHPPKWIETLLSEKKQNDNSANSTDEQASGRLEEVPLAQDEANEESNVDDLPDDHTVSPDQHETSRGDQASRFNLRKKPLPPDCYK